MRFAFRPPVYAFSTFERFWVKSDQQQQKNKCLTRTTVDTGSQKGWDGLSRVSRY